MVEGSPDSGTLHAPCTVYSVGASRGGAPPKTATPRRPSGIGVHVVTTCVPFRPLSLCSPRCSSLRHTFFPFVLPSVHPSFSNFLTSLISPREIKAKAIAAIYLLLRLFISSSFFNEPFRRRISFVTLDLQKSSCWNSRCVLLTFLECLCRQQNSWYFLRAVARVRKLRRLPNDATDIDIRYV